MLLFPSTTKYISNMHYRFNLGLTSIFLTEKNAVKKLFSHSSMYNFQNIYVIISELSAMSPFIVIYA